MNAGGEELAAKVRARTRSGLDEDGRQFAPSASGEGSDLHASGQMLDDLQVTSATSNKVTVGFRTERSAKIAALLDGGTRHMPARPFMGLSPEWVSAFIKRVMSTRR